MTQPAASPDPTLAIAERQLAILAELSNLGMEAARAFATSAVASAKAAEAILGEEYFMPEVGRARACGAKDAAESFQKISRSVRLTMMLEMNVGEIARDIAAGIVTYIGGIAHSNRVGGDPGAVTETPGPVGRSAGVFAGLLPDPRDSDARSRDSNTERLSEFERLEALPRAPLRETVEQICDDLGATVDWKRWSLHPRAPDNDTLSLPALACDLDVKSPGRSPPNPARPPG